jgi:transposase
MWHSSAPSFESSPRHSAVRCPERTRQLDPDSARIAAGTTTLFAALEVATGKVTDACYPPHRHEEFLRFLKHVAKTYPRVKLHIVCDNHATRKHPSVQGWLAKNPRITMHFTPTSGSWLNMVEIFFGIITRQALRRWHLHLGQRPHRRNRELHRRLERALRALHLDQDHGRDHPQGQGRSKNFIYAALAHCLAAKYASLRFSRAFPCISVT